MLIFMFFIIVINIVIRIIVNIVCPYAPAV